MQESKLHCPLCKDIIMLPVKYDYHRKVDTHQPYNTFLTVLYECPICKTTVETSQQVRITSPKEE